VPRSGRVVLGWQQKVKLKRRRIPPYKFLEQLSVELRSRAPKPRQRRRGRHAKCAKMSKHLLLIKLFHASQWGIWWRSRQQGGMSRVWGSLSRYWSLDQPEVGQKSARAGGVSIKPLRVSLVYSAEIKLRLISPRGFYRIRKVHSDYAKQCHRSDPKGVTLTIEALMTLLQKQHRLDMPSCPIRRMGRTTLSALRTSCICHCTGNSKADLSVKSKSQLKNLDVELRWTYKWK